MPAGWLKMTYLVQVNFIQKNKQQSIFFKYKLLKVQMPFQNCPRRVKNIVFLTLNSSIKQK